MNEITDQDKINFKEKYENLKEYYQHNPVAFIEETCPDIKLLPYQKILLNTIMSKQNDFYYINPYTAQKRWLANMKLEYMKAMGMNFEVWSPKGIDVYENGMLVRTLKHNKGDI